MKYCGFCSFSCQSELFVGLEVTNGIHCCIVYPVEAQTGQQDPFRPLKQANGEENCLKKGNCSLSREHNFVGSKFSLG